MGVPDLQQSSRCGDVQSVEIVAVKTSVASQQGVGLPRGMGTNQKIGCDSLTWPLIAGIGAHDARGLQCRVHVQSGGNRGHPRVFLDGALEVALPANPGTAHTASREGRAYCAGLG